MCECLQQVPRQRVRSTTVGEVLLTKLLGGEGSALGEMVRFVSSRLLKIKIGFLKNVELLSRVPHWGVEEVLSWVAAAGFKEFCPVFKVK